MFLGIAARAEAFMLPSHKLSLFWNQSLYWETLKVGNWPRSLRKIALNMASRTCRFARDGKPCCKTKQVRIQVSGEQKLFPSSCCSKCVGLGVIKHLTGGAALGRYSLGLYGLKPSSFCRHCSHSSLCTKTTSP